MLSKNEIDFLQQYVTSKGNRFYDNVMRATPEQVLEALHVWKKTIQNSLHEFDNCLSVNCREVLLNDYYIKWKIIRLLRHKNEGEFTW